MKHSTYTSYDDLPLMLSVAEVAAVLGISRAGAYELARSSGFPALKIGSRIVVPKDKFLAWIDANSGSKTHRCNQRRNPCIKDTTHTTNKITTVTLTNFSLCPSS